MTRFFITEPSGEMVKGQRPRIEVDRCGRCGRLWFDKGELERATGGRYLSRLKGGPGPHPCLVCQGATVSTLVAGEVTVEECHGCGCVMLDPKGVSTLLGEPVVEVAPPLPQPVGAPPKKMLSRRTADIEVACERCGDTVKLVDSGNVNGAIVCRSCELAPWPDQQTWDRHAESTSNTPDLFGFIARWLFG